MGVTSVVRVYPGPFSERDALREFTRLPPGNALVVGGEVSTRGVYWAPAASMAYLFRRRRSSGEFSCSCLELSPSDWGSRTPAQWMGWSGCIGREEPLLATISTAGSATLNNPPMTILDLLTLQSASTPGLHYLVVLAGGDLGPRLLPSDSLAGLLWLAACRRQGVQLPLKWFVKVGAMTLVPAPLGAVGLLVWLNG